MPLTRNRSRLQVSISLALVGGQVAVVIIMMSFINSTLSVSESTRSKVQLLDTARAQREDDAHIDYDDIYNLFGTHKSYTDWQLSDLDSFDNYTYPCVLAVGCSLTVSILDPRPPISGSNHSIWFALESVASYAPYACVVFHTASCRLIIKTKKMRSLPTN